MILKIWKNLKWNDENILKTVNLKEQSSIPHSFQIIPNEA